MNWIKTNWKGIILCLIIAIPAWLLGQLVPVVGGPVFSILIGMLVTLLVKDKTKFNPGIAFTSKKILQYAIILLGFGMNLLVIAATGLQSLPIILSTISTSLLISFVLYKTMKIPSKISVLVGVGSSICGGSAIAATAPVIGADDDEIAQSISVIFLFNVIAALLFPTLGGLLGLSDYGFGLFAGTAVNDTSSVTAAATAWDAIHHSNTLETAAVVKLTRTLAIIPITMALAFYRTKKEKDIEGNKFKLKKVFPFFILYFVLASVITTICNSLGVPNEIFSSLKTLSKFLIVMAMAAIGFNTNIIKLIRGGGKAIFVGLCCWIGIACVSLFMQQLLGIW
ncbi:MAG: YeiH family protein [Oscillospiraceae bacterium]